MFQCPRCTQPVNAPELAGQLVACPACEHQFVMPGGLIIDSPSGVPQVVSSVLPPTPPPVMIFAQHSQPRLHSGGWFTRGFATTAGVLVAVALAMFLMCGGMQWFVGRAISGDVAMQAKAKRQALASLKPYGIRELAKEVSAGNIGNRWAVVGPALAADNRIVDVSVTYDVATIGDTTRWTLVEMYVDGERIRRP